MKRIQLFEFEDFTWFPSSIRTSMTHLIVVFLKIMGTKEVLANLLAEVKKAVNFKRIVDMGSGSGSAMMMAVQEYNEKNTSKIQLLLTDLHPNADFVEKINNNGDTNINYQRESFDATNMSQAPDGLKTMVNSFHHLRPAMAKQVLKTAYDNRQPILVFEIVENKIPVLIWALFLPVAISLLMVMTLFMTPFVRPLTWQQVVFTYVVPIIPFCYAWDGQASMPRTYSFSDLQELTSGLRQGYNWKIEPALKPNGKKSGYYLLGWPQ